MEHVREHKKNSIIAVTRVNSAILNMMVLKRNGKRGKKKSRGKFNLNKWIKVSYETTMTTRSYLETKYIQIRTFFAKGERDGLAYR